MGKLHDIGIKHNTDKATHHKYLDFYEKHLPKPGFNGRLLEIGIRDGASLRMWHEYYPDADIVGIDIEPAFEIPGVTTLQLDSKDIMALQDLGRFDVIIDDGSHMTLDQQIAFYWLYFNQLQSDGVYILEDLHTSLLPEYVNSKYTTITMLDRLNYKLVQYRRTEAEADSMSVVLRAGQ